MASVPLPSMAPNRANPQPTQDLHRSHDQLPLPRPAPSPLLLGCPLKSSSCPTLTRMRMLEMDREFVELRNVCRTWGASLLRRMPSGLARPVHGGWGHANDRGIRDHGDSSTRPPLPLSGSTVCLPRPGWVAPIRLPRLLGRSALYPRGGVARLRSVHPVSGPRLVRVLPPVVGFPPPPVGAGEGALAPDLHDVPVPPPRSARGRSRLRVSGWAPWLSAARRLTPRPPPPPGPQVVAGRDYGRCASWSRVADGGHGGGGWRWQGISRRSKRWMWGTPRGGRVTHMPGGRLGRRPRQWRSCGRMGRWFWQAQRGWWVWGGGGMGWWAAIHRLSRGS